MYRPLIMSSLLVVAAVAGCFGSAEEQESTSTSTSPATDPERSYKVFIRNYTDEGGSDQPINVTWEVLPTVDDENATNQSVTVSHTSIHWGNESVKMPGSSDGPPATKGNATPTNGTGSTSPTTANTFAAAVLTTHATSTTTSTTTATATATKTGGGNASGGADYPNETVEQSGIVGSTFNESFVVNASGLIYIRAHAIIGNKSYWSDEYVVNVTGNATLPLGKQHIVTYSGTPGGPLSRASPSPLNIKVGDSVVWKNADTAPVQNSHTAESTAGNPSFNTGSIAPNGQSKPVFFNATGTWTYRCGNHANTMNGYSIVVTA